VAKRAFFLLNTERGSVEETVNALKQIEGVKSADRVTGPYDVIAVLEEEDLMAMEDLEARIVKRIPHISRSVTCISLVWPCANTLSPGKEEIILTAREGRG
jgi:DNA-binding Lrp family transcriptional regulator